jgi:hypothetical protein
MFILRMKVFENYITKIYNRFNIEFSIFVILGPFL